MNERERIAVLLERFAACAPTREAGATVRMGIGDDAAVLSVAESPAAAAAATPIVWTIDAQVEGTHFRRAWLAWEDIGFRSFMAAASDIAAMGASPIAALSSIVLTNDVDDAAFDALTRGQAEAANALHAPIVGGNLARASSETSITTTLLGRASSSLSGHPLSPLRGHEPLTRAGARPGDRVYLGGAVGMAGAGLAVLLNDALPAQMQNAHIAECLAAWRRPTAQIDLGLAISISGLATSAIDISDGLALDASHVAMASGVRIVLLERALCEAFVTPSLAATCALIKREPLDLILHGGEDYALLVTLSASSLSANASAVPKGLVLVGVVEECTTSPEVMIERENGAREVLPPIGFDHFASPTTT